MNDTRYIGKVCGKHPGLAGERLKVSGTCVRCKSENELIRHRKARDQVLDHYGPICACCGETIRQFLTIDHVDGGGNEHRKNVVAAQHLARWIVSHGFPPDFQILCFNCNTGRHINGGVCPHKLEQ